MQTYFNRDKVSKEKIVDAAVAMKEFGCFFWHKKYVVLK